MIKNANSDFDIIVTTLFGLEELLAQEIKNLGVVDTEILNRAVKFSGNKELLYKCNLNLRTALKVLKPIGSFTARNERELYDGIQKFRWDNFLRIDKTLAVEATTVGEIFTHSKYAALKTKDAIVDQFRDKYGKRPNVDTENPDLQINVHINDTLCSVSLDSSGVHLGKRGYRLAQNLAPLSEVLAAGIIYLTGWDKMGNFTDPMCGSGTIPIEAALMANNIPAGSFRHFCFERWSDFDSELWENVKNEAFSKIIPFDGKIFAREIDKRTIEIAKKNAERAGVEKYINFKCEDFLKSEDEASSGVIVMNPPYGERMNDKDDIIPFYDAIGTKLKHFYNGCDAWIVSSNIQALKRIGLKPSRKIKVFNGPLECRLYKFELYKGSRKPNKQSVEDND